MSQEIATSGISLHCIPAIKILFFLSAFCLCLGLSSCQSTNDRRLSKVQYELLENDSLQSIILLKDSVNKEQLNIVADSLFKLKKPTEDNFRVWFYYRSDWKGHIYYAGKFWAYDIMQHDYLPPKLDITGIKSSDK